ncbi:chemotaxis protein CheW [Deltaproteobacteria bacterium TL4]
MTEVLLTQETLDHLRKSFDHSFSLPPATNKIKRTQVLIFTLANEHYAVPLSYVQEIIKVTHISKVPCTPPVILGIMNLNGELISISDIHHFFDLRAQASDPANRRIIVTKNLPFKTGMLVDSIERTLALDEKEIQPPLSTLNTIKSEFIQGVFYSHDKLVVLLAMKNLMNSPEMQIK